MPAQVQSVERSCPSIDHRSDDQRLQQAGDDQALPDRQGAPQGQRDDGDGEQRQQPARLVGEGGDQTVEQCLFKGLARLAGRKDQYFRQRSEQQGEGNQRHIGQPAPFELGSIAGEQDEDRRAAIEQVVRQLRPGEGEEAEDDDEPQDRSAEAAR